MKKVIRLTEKDLTKLVKKIITENERVYGSSEIEKLRRKLGDDEDVQLDDSSGELSGKITKKVEIVKDLLKTGLRKKDWDNVSRALSYLEIKFK
jgi:hypothetical protein